MEIFYKKRKAPLNLLDMRLEIGPRSGFGMSCGGEQPSKISYSDLLRIAHSKDAWVAGHIQF
jgi:hypothetical protein